MNKKIIIIGSGIAGTIAYNFFKEFNPIVIDKGIQRYRIKPHDAIMRLRDSQIAEYLGTYDYDPVKITKAIYYKDMLCSQSNIILNNLYSMKVYNELGNRSLNNLETVDRYLIDGFPAPARIHWNKNVYRIENNIIYTIDEETGKEEEFKYDICISTIPMPFMKNIIRSSKEILNVNFKYNPVYTIRIKLPFNSNVHQTIYYPEISFPVYRATIQKNILIIEAIKINKNDIIHINKSYLIKYVLRSFGIDKNILNKVKAYYWNEIKIGKIMAIDETIRLKYIIWLTDMHSIFSFGRFAVWRPLRADHLIDDIKKIQRMIKANKIQCKYKSRINEA